MSSSTIETGLSLDALQVHRALASLQEELEAIDFYHQRQDTAEDAALKAVLVHNQDDEMEHAVMLLEWLRRTLPALDGQLRKILFQEGAITTLASSPAPEGGGLGLGNLTQQGPSAQGERA